jgi:hypothetical protein
MFNDTNITTIMRSRIKYSLVSFYVGVKSKKLIQIHSLYLKHFQSVLIETVLAIFCKLLFIGKLPAVGMTRLEEIFM